MSNIVEDGMLTPTQIEQMKTDYAYLKDREAAHGIAMPLGFKCLGSALHDLLEYQRRWVAACEWMARLSGDDLNLMKTVTTMRLAPLTGKDVAWGKEAFRRIQAEAEANSASDEKEKEETPQTAPEPPADAPSDADVEALSAHATEVGQRHLVDGDFCEARDHLLIGLALRELLARRNP